MAFLSAGGSAWVAQEAAIVSGTLTHEGRSMRLTHLASSSTSWPLVCIVFTTTPIPRDVLADETAKHDFLRRPLRGSISP